jgi:hypothetical protein
LVAPLNLELFGTTTIQAGVVFLAVLIAYSRILPLWLLLLVVGGVAWLSHPAPASETTQEDQDGPDLVLGRDRAEMKHAVGWV